MCILLILNDILMSMPKRLDVEKRTLNFYEYFVDGLMPQWVLLDMNGSIVYSSC